MKRFTAAIAMFAATAAAPLHARADEPTPSAQEAQPFLTEDEEAVAEFEREMEDAFAVFGDLFKVEPLTPEQAALLPLSQKMTDVIMPVGSFGLVMQDTMGPMIDGILGGLASDPRLRLGALTGVDGDILAGLDDETAQEALDIFDPLFAARHEKLGSLVVEMMGQMFSALEPAYREAYSRALATRFSEAEMTDLLAFFETPTGAKFANASFTIQYDPQMLGVMEQMGPAMVEVLPGMMEGFASMEAEFAKERKFTELSEAERARAAQLLGKSVAELEALQPEGQSDEGVEEEAALFEAA